jgi:hypothetical protein
VDGRGRRGQADVAAPPRLEVIALESLGLVKAAAAQGQAAVHQRQHIEGGRVGLFAREVDLAQPGGPGSGRRLALQERRAQCQRVPLAQALGANHVASFWRLANARPAV